MIAAIYARKSDDQTGVSEDARSVARQIEHSRAYIARKGWTLDEAHVYWDEITGAEFARRPGFVRLMNALKPRPPFQALVMMEQGRLGREQIETSYALKQLITGGVRVFVYLEDRELTLGSPIDKLLLSVTAFADELEREKARARTKDALTRKAEAGYVAGGSTFGYTNERVNAHSEYRVNEAEAEVVRRIFQLAAEGRGARWIAHRLNDERVPAPLPRQAGRPRAWAPSTIYAMLTRPLYRGEIVWNRSKKRDAWGIKKQSVRPKEEWVRLEAPDLRIVPEPLWQAVQDRLKTSRASYLRASNGQLWGRPANGIDSKYLLTGLAQCGVCGGSLIVHSRASGPGRKHSYLCSYYHLRGTTVCPTGLLTAMNSTNEAVLDVFERQILNPKAVEVALREGLNQLRPSGDSLVPQRAALQAELGVLDQELGRLSAAVAQGGDLTALLDAIKSREQRRRKLQDELAGLQGLEKIAAIDLPKLQQDLEARLADWRDLLNRQVPVARQILKKLLVGRIVFRQTDQGIEFTGKASLGKVLAGIVGTKAGVAPTGFEPVFQP